MKALLASAGVACLSGINLNHTVQCSLAQVGLPVDPIAGWITAVATVVVGVIITTGIHRVLKGLDDLRTNQSHITHRVSIVDRNVHILAAKQGCKLPPDDCES